MVDNVAVLPPGWRALDNNGELITDGILAFFAAGTTTPIQVYADSVLTVSLGTSVSCNSAGYPVTGANAKTLIYTGIAPYKIRLTSGIFGGTVFEHDNVFGALDTSGFLTSSFTPSKFIIAEPNDRAVGAPDKGKLIDVDCSAGAKTMTIGDATVLGSGWWCGIRHNGSANQVKIIGDGADLFALNSVNVTAFSLTGRGQVVYMVCDGTGFKIDGQVPPLIGGTIGTIVIADRLSTPPGSPVAGARYIVTVAPTGAWSTFAQHDIAEATGQGTWFKYTPFADCGWTAFVQDEDVNYQFRGSAWVSTVPTVQRFTSGVAATYTPPAGVSSIRVRMVGGGGGGGASATNGGANGVDSSFGSWTAIKGSGGAFGASGGGAGGIGGTSGVDGTGTLVVRFDGEAGRAGHSGAGGVWAGGPGGASLFGGSGASIENAAGLAAKANSGSGGGGGGSNSLNSGGGGGAGEYVEFFVPAPSATTYTVGSGGAGAAAGTFAGGAGAAGIIIVEEFY